MGDDRFNIITLDEFEQFEACRIQQVVTGHCLMDDIKNKPKSIVVRQLREVESILKADKSTEEFQSSYTLCCRTKNVKMSTKWA
ncbi:hypothetical protein TMatcc_002639 [Talaromyces marneffei ATCC 18224]